MLLVLLWMTQKLKKLFINVFQVIRLLIERRPVPIAKELRDIYRSVFSDLNTREFLYFWSMGKYIAVDSGFLCRRDTVQDELLLVLEGKVQVTKKGIQVAELSRGDFIAEMSFMTGEPATADVTCNDNVRLIAWSQRKIHNLEHLNSQLLMKIQVILGKDMSRKIEHTR